jgi:hypothetical protein
MRTGKEGVPGPRGTVKPIDPRRSWPYFGGGFLRNVRIFGELAIPTNEFSRRLVIDPWPGGGMSVDVSADAAERRALAARFDLLDLPALRGHGRLERRGDELVLRGWLEADVVQECVVTLEPAPARLRQPIERRYRLGGTSDAPQARYEPHGTVVLDDGADDVESVIGREIDLGEAFAEELGAALDPYPRAPGAALDAGDLGPHVSVGSADRLSEPFAALRRLQDKHAR